MLLLMVLKDHWELRTEDVRPESLQDGGPSEGKGRGTRAGCSCRIGGPDRVG